MQLCSHLLRSAFLKADLSNNALSSCEVGPVASELRVKDQT